MTNNETYTRSSNPIGFRQFLFACLFLCLGLVAPQQLLAQLSTATMFGTVTDSTGAVIPNAIVVLTQTDTNFIRQTTTNGQGQYRAEFLPIMASLIGSTALTIAVTALVAAKFLQRDVQPARPETPR